MSHPRLMFTFLKVCLAHGSQRLEHWFEKSCKTTWKREHQQKKWNALLLLPASHFRQRPCESQHSSFKRLQPSPSHTALPPNPHKDVSTASTGLLLLNRFPWNWWKDGTRGRFSSQVLSGLIQIRQEIIRSSVQVWKLLQMETLLKLPPEKKLRILEKIKEPTY